MDRGLVIALIGLVVGTLNLCRIVPSTFAFEKPLLTATTCLVTLSVSLLVASRTPRKDGVRAPHSPRYELLPEGIWPGLRELRSQGSRSSISRHLRLIIILIAAICLRIQLFIRVLASVECSTFSLEPLLPLVFATGDFLAVRFQRRLSTSNATSADAYHESDDRTSPKSLRRLLCAVFASVASIITLVLTRGPASTHICSVFLNPSWLIPSLQLAGTALDAFVIYCTKRLLTNNETQAPRPTASKFTSLGYSIFGAALVSGVILVLESIVYKAAFRNKQWFNFTSSYIASAVELNLTVLITALCAIVSMLHVDAATVTLIPMFTALCAFTLSYGWRSEDGFARTAFIPKHAKVRLFMFTLATLGFGGYFHFDTAYQSTPLFRRRMLLLYLGLIILLVSQFGIWARGPTSYYSGHDIQRLILSGQGRHTSFVTQASSSSSLSQAAKTYQQRYSRPAPPGFEKWYQYATNRSSVIIDDFDSINRDLLPFFALTPEQIRDRTWQMISNKWHDASGLMIRNGEISIAENMPPTHRWMLEGVASLIKPFAEWLPDMDLAFNINDEPRVVVPYEVIEPMRQKGSKAIVPDKRPQNSFSSGRAAQWKPIPEKNNDQRHMGHGSGRNTFKHFGAAGCPPGSPARTQRLWDVSRLCTECVEPHSESGFLRDWELAGDICHQPDLADLHGMYISPASFKGTNELFPVFSQSKAHGFNDILYPSAWNYMEKSRYAPTEEFPDVKFINKNHSIYWRGGTTEGLSHDFGHDWKGMARQRFISLANNNHHRSPTQPLLIPFDPENAKGAYHWITLPTSELKDIIPASMNFVNEINRCAGLDCIQQEHEFSPLAPHVPFQECWQYKYLLDLDGAGFSGRFLPFLQSRSLPFKAALYREWWDDRVEAWHHFVPLDLRGHGFWATLAYFAGWDGPVEWRNRPDGFTKDGKLIRGEPRNDVAEQLAENGREWARVALRKEDMEIYMFRLLLEWGRLTDDRREEIGFVVD